MSEGSTMKLRTRKMGKVLGEERLVGEVKKNPEWLPPGWILEVRTVKSGVFAGREYKCYFDPTTGSRYYSKKKAVLYLMSVNSPTVAQKGSTRTDPTDDSPPSSNHKGSIVTDSNENVCTLSSNGRSIVKESPKYVQCTSDDLPHGWNKILKIRKASKIYGIKKDPLYTDIMSGYVFRSLKDVQRYIESGEISRRSFKMERSHIYDMFAMEKESPPLTAAKRRISQRTEARRCLFPEQLPGSNVKISEGDALQNDPSAQNTKVADYIPACHREIISPQPLSVKLPSTMPTKTFEQVDEKRSVHQDNLPQDKKLEHSSERPSHSAYRKPRRGAKKRTGAKKNVSGDPGGSQKQGIGVRTPPKNKGLKVITMPLRSSKRLAGLKADPVADSGIIERSRLAREKRFKPAPSLDGDGASSLAFKRSDEPKASPAAKRSKPAPSLDGDGASSLAFERSDGPKASPAAEQSCEQRGEGKPNDDNPESAFTLPFGDSWSDPCIQFAFRTLTSDIPVLDGIAAIQEYIEQQLTPAQGPAPPTQSGLQVERNVNVNVEKVGCTKNGSIPEREFNIKKQT